MAAALVASGIWPVAPASGLAPRTASAVEVRSFYPSEFGLSGAAGIAHDPDNGALLVAGEAQGSAMPLLALHPDETVIAHYSVAGVDDPASITFDPAASRLLGSKDGELVSLALPSAGGKASARATGRQIGDAAGTAVDPHDGDLLVLGEGAATVRRVRPGGAGDELTLRGLPKGELGAIATNPTDGGLYVASADGSSLYSLDDQGSVAAVYDLTGVAIADVQSMVFAPSADHTDAASVYNLFVVDGGTASSAARVVEVSLTAATVTAAAPATEATLVKTTALSAMPIPSPDSSGVAWIRHQSRLLVVDSEVNEMPWLWNVYATNAFPITYGGSLFTSDVGNTTSWTREPTGVSYNPINTHIFITDDNADRVYEFNPGPDQRYATPDDTVTNLNVKPFNNLDGEDVAFDTATGHLWVIDGVDKEVFRYAPGADGKFGTGDDPAPTNWDVGIHGAIDPEGIAHYEADDTLFVLDNRTKKIYVFSKTGALLQTIGIGATNAINAAGVGLAPPSNGGPGLNLYIVDRGIDNGADPNENDGKLYEMSAGLVGGAPSNLPPIASAAAPPSAPGADLTITSSTFPVSATLDASASTDPEGGPLTYAWTQLSGPTATIATPSSASTSVDLTALGTYTFQVTVTDGATPPLSSSASVRIIVDPPGGSVTFSAAVATGSDDAEETVSSGNIQLTSSDLDMVLDGTTHKSAALRFTNVTIPKNATITGASIQFRADEAGSSAATLTIAGEANDNPSTFTSAKFNLSSRPRTAATVSWTPPAWTTVNQVGPDQRTPELIPIVQELVNRSGWTSGNAMVFFINGPATGTRVADSLEGGYAPTITITYTS